MMKNSTPKRIISAIRDTCLKAGTWTRAKKRNKTIAIKEK
jgi:hypothetical protein